MSTARRAWGTGRIYKRARSPFWFIRWRDATGKRRTLSTRTTKYVEAERMLRQQLDLRERGANPDARKVTFTQLIDLIIDDRRVRGLTSELPLKRLRDEFGSAKAINITSAAIRRYERQRLDAGATRATVNNELAVLRRMFNLAVEHRLLLRDQAPIIHTPDPKNARQGFFEPSDFEAIVHELPEYLRPIMRFGYYTGWRVRSEVLPLQWRQIDFDAGTVRLEPNTTKNKEARTFPFAAHPALKALLEQQREATKALEKRTGVIVPWVFHRDGNPIWNYRSEWESACDRAAHDGKGKLRVLARPHLMGRLVHDLRRTAVRNLERAGVPRSVAMKLTGHKTEAVYRRYAITSAADLSEGVAKLAALDRASVSQQASA